MEEERRKATLLSLLEEVAAEEGFRKPSIQIGGGAELVNGFIGEVQRVVIEETESGYEKPTLRLVVKCMPASSSRRKLYEYDDFFSNEAVFFNEIIPAFRDFQIEKGIAKDLTPLHPRCLRASDLLITEDQNSLGYIVKDSRDTLDYAHCLLVMRELGRLHAVSFALRDQRPALFKKLSTSVKETAITKEIHPSMIDWFLHAFHKTIKKFMERSQVTNKSKYLDALKKMEVDYYEKILELVSPTNAEPYSVINHADCWTSNVLFKYRKGCEEPDSLCLLDFQLARLASPACDITLFLFCCTDKSTRDANYLDLLQGYHSSLATHLASLGSDVDTLFPMEALQDQLRRYGRFGMLRAMGLLPIFTCNSDEMPDIDDACKGDSESFDHSNDKECWDRVCCIIVDAVDYGYMD